MAPKRTGIALAAWLLAPASWAAPATARPPTPPRDPAATEAPFVQALGLLSKSRAGAKQKPDPDDALQLRALDDLGLGHLRAGRYAEAEPLLAEVLERRTRRNGPDDGERLRSAHTLATVYLNSGQLAKADPVAADALSRADRALGRDHPTTIHAVAVVAQIRAAQGRYAEAEPLFRRAYETARRIAGPESRTTLDAAILLARTLRDTGRYPEAEALYRRTAADAATAFGNDHPLTLTTRDGIGTTLLFQGRHAEAETVLREVSAGFDRSGGRESLAAILTLSNLAAAIQWQGRSAEAEPMLLQAIETGERTIGLDDPNVTLFISNLANLYLEQGRIDEAIPMAERALEQASRRQGPDSPRALLYAHNLGSALLSAGRLADAEPLLARAFAGRERTYGFDHRDTLATATSVGYVRQRQGRTVQAEALVRRVLAASERVLGPGHPETLVARLNLATFLAPTGRIEEAEPLLARVLADGTPLLPAGDDILIEAAGSLSAARQFLRARRGAQGLDAIAPARQAVAGLRARRIPGGGRFGAAQAARESISRSDYFVILADALLQNRPGEAERFEAFAALQDASAGTTDRAVMQMAARRFADSRSGGLGALVREREALERTWAANARRQVDLLTVPGVTPEERTAVRNEATDVERRLDAVDARLRERFPDYFQFINPQAIRFGDIASVLRPDEVLLMIVPGERGTHLMTVTDRGIVWRGSPATREPLAPHVRRLLWQLGGTVQPTAGELAGWSREPAGAFDRALAHRLYTELVAPMHAELAGKRHVFVAAAGVLSGLPLGVLVTEPPRGRDGDPAALRQTRWLADAHALIQVPSAQSLLLLRRVAANVPAPGTRFLGFGDPLLDGAPRARLAEAARGATLPDVASLRRMARLPGTADELRNMRAAFSAPANSIYLGAAATERRLRTMDLGDVGILALATHGLMAGQIDGANEPGLVLTPPAAPSAEDDGYLAASEIAALRLNAEWVILSACNTASGDGTSGAQGLSGLARAFFYAGARTLLASHWPVRDDVGAALTVRAIQLEQAQPQLSRAEAFQRAMREIRDDAGHDWAHPNAWAPFTLIGDAAR